MTKSLPIDIDKFDQSYYIPHHAVLRDNSATTCLRVVFNASCRTINGMSLNDYMLVCPKFQRDLAILAIMRWRQDGYVFISDIVKMYRQIFVHIRDIDYQRIMWSFPSKSISEYYLLTIIYGTAAASYLTLRGFGPSFWANSWKMRAQNFRSRHRTPFCVIRNMLMIALSTQTTKCSSDRRGIN